MKSEFDEKAKTWDTPEKQQRAKQVARALKKQVPLSKNMKAFEYGCGTGLLSFALKEMFNHITLADVSEGMLSVLKGKINANSIKNMYPLSLDLIQGDLPEERFDIVYTQLTLHHITDIPKILYRFYNILNPGGWLCIVDLDTEDGSFHGKERTDLHLGFDRAAFGQLVKTAGFEQITFSPAHTIRNHENPHGKKGDFSLFLMTAQRAQ